MSDESMKNEPDKNNNVTLWRNYGRAGEPSPTYKAKYLNIHNHHYHGDHSNYNEMERENAAERVLQPSPMPLDLLEKASEGLDDGVTFSTKDVKPADHWILTRHDIPSDSREVFCQNELRSFVATCVGGVWLNAHNGARILGVLRWMDIPPEPNNA